MNLNYEDDERFINENGKSDGDQEQDDYVSGSQWKLGLEEAP